MLFLRVLCVLCGDPDRGSDPNDENRRDAEDAEEDWTMSASWSRERGVSEGSRGSDAPGPSSCYLPPMNVPAADAVLNRMAAAGYTVFRNGLHNLNLVGLRATPGTPNAFCDLICAVYYASTNDLRIDAFPATTKPGTYWLQNPSKVDGTAILMAGQHRGAFTFGKHKGAYECLVQKTPLPVRRDDDHDDVADPTKGVVQTGMFNIEIHHASDSHASTVVNKWSAGCQVLSDPHDFLNFMNLCRLSAQTYGTAFTYTLLDWPA